MPTFERVEDGKVVERVITVHNSNEDNRLGVAAVDGEGGWRVVTDTPDKPAEPAAADSAPAEKPAEQSTEPSERKAARKS